MYVRDFDPDDDLIIVEARMFGKYDDRYLMLALDTGASCGLDGLLGLNFLRNFNYQIRSREGRILLDRAA